MAFEPKPGQFALFKNDKKGNDKAPDYRGDGMDLAGNTIEVVAWLKEGAKGKFMSCSIKLKQAKPESTKPAPKSSSVADMDSDCPF